MCSKASGEVLLSQRAEVQRLAGDLHVGLIGESKLGLAVTVSLFIVNCNGLVTHQACALPQPLHYSNMDKLLRKWIVGISVYLRELTM